MRTARETLLMRFYKLQETTAPQAFPAFICEAIDARSTSPRLLNRG
jgi:hypothetical protein